MSQELVTIPQRSLVVAQHKKRTFDEQEVATLRATFGKTLDPLEFKVYIATASHLNLDPFGREIYCLKYGTHPMTLITSIGGYRKMSSRSGRYLGLTEGTFLVRTEQGQTLTVKHSELDPDMHTIVSATIGIRVDGFPEPVYATALMKSCVKKVNNAPTENWKIMPDVMLMKCAEAAAHRRAALFPDGAGAVFVEEEVNRYDLESLPVKTIDQTTPAILPAAKPEPAKRTRTTKALPQEPAQTENAAPWDESGWDNSPAGQKFRQIESFYRPQMSDPDAGWRFATSRILNHFGVPTLEEITDVEALRHFCTEGLLKELREENFIAMPKKG